MNRMLIIKTKTKLKAINYKSIEFDFKISEYINVFLWLLTVYYREFLFLFCFVDLKLIHSKTIK